MKLKLFYLIKPLIPRRIQLFLRRKYARSIFSQNKDVWPILPGSEKKPDNWPGWPDGKKFAMILTHDVESQTGYDKVINLMNIEKTLGFVSSFNFVPERDYVVKKELIESLQKNGFECGVHGLHHDGKLFLSEKEFLKRAVKINNYLKDWNAVGFRAPAMHHDLELIGELNISYDLSTFDTDPFEPQPEGVNIIFPFFVNNKRHRNKGYIEMPYTLAQDSLLFLILREKDIKIWQNKLDWIVKNGGMALINVHPDYISFSNNGRDANVYPIKFYELFLQYVSEKYHDQYWNVLPKDLAMYWKRLYANNNSEQSIIDIK